MEIVRSTESGVAVVGIVGDFDTPDVPAFEEAVASAIRGGGPRVVVDAARVRFVGSTALGSLVRAQQALHDAGGDIALAAMPRFASCVFRTLGLGRKIRTFPTVGEAAAWLAG